MDIQSLKKAFLNPAIYPDRPTNVVFLETHISLLFLTGTHVYKVKKPVDFGFLDFTSLEKRRYFCEQEVTLNRRLAPSLYLGVVRITEEKGRVSLDGEGEVTEYAVLMKQIAICRRRRIVEPSRGPEDISTSPIVMRRSLESLTNDISFRSAMGCLDPTIWHLSPQEFHWLYDGAFITLFISAERAPF